MKIVQAVGFAHKPGRNTIKADIWRFFMRLFVWCLFRSGIPLHQRQSALFIVLGLRKRFLGLPMFAGASKSDTFEQDLLKLIFNATAIANIADNAATSPLTNLFVALHTADPGESGVQNTSECTYTSYARVSVARTSGGWTVSGTTTVSPVATISFPAGTGGSGTATFFSIGVASSGATKILYSGTVTPNIVTGNGITPQLTTATAITED